MLSRFDFFLNFETDHLFSGKGAGVDFFQQLKLDLL